jgi:uncharacterized protein HemY
VVEKNVQDSRRRIWLDAQNRKSELKGLRLHGMVSAWTDLTNQGTTSAETSKWLIEHLLQAENTDRAMRSVRHQLPSALARCSD